MGRRPFGKPPRVPIVQVTIPDHARWNQILRSLPGHHVLQSWEWGEFKQRYGWQAERLAFRAGDRIVAAAQVLGRQARPLPLSILYVPKGPVLDYANGSLRMAVLRALVAHGRRRRAIFVKIDPDVVLGTGVPGTDEERAAPTGVAFCQDLTAAGWRFSQDQVQFRNTVQLDLRQSQDELLAAMKQKTRYNIRLAARKGVMVRRGTRDDLGLLFRMYAETAERDGFIIRPLSYYRNAWGSFIEAGLACPLIAEYQGEALGAVILFAFGERAWYMYGASRDAHRDKMPNQLLQWEAICWARDQGASIYDMWGAPNEFVEQDPMYGVWRFKEGFGGQVVRHVGAWDRIISRPWHWVYTVVIPLYLGFRRSLKR